MADDMINYLVTAACCLIVGGAFHSFWGHWMQRRVKSAIHRLKVYFGFARARLIEGEN